ncbi:MAG: hypothetical protein OEY49_19015 [Candidatus Heimdallarchaeota archaeon]|nr:hypothetical protein [Candidatus Heimdallarchaeota archaeon]
MNKKNLFMLIIMGTFVFNHPVTGVPGDSFADPITAYLGNNYGSITGNEYEYFWFDNLGSYKFSLTGPSETDLDMKIYDGNQNQIDSATSTSYPDETSTASTNGFYIGVYSYSGTGSFTLNIEEVALVSSYEYYSGFNMGDVLEWTYSQTNTTSSISDSMQVTVEFLTDSHVDYVSTTENLFHISINGSLQQDDMVGVYLIPVRMNYGDGTYTTDFSQLLTNFWGSTDVNCYSGLCEIHIGSGIATYDELTGAVLSYSGMFSEFEESVQLVTDISQYHPTPGPQIVSLEYYGFSQGDLFEWSLTESNSTHTETNILSIEVLVNNPVDYINTEEILFRVSYDGDSYLSEGPEFPLLPIRLNLDNGTSLLFQDILELFFEGDPVSCNTVECTVMYSNSYGTYSETATIKYDLATGLLTSYEGTVTNSGSSSSVSATLDTPLPGSSGNTDTTSNGFSIPFNLYFGSIFLMGIPILRRKYK